MAIQYHVTFECENEEVSIIRTFNGKTTKSNITREILQIREMCRFFNWCEFEELSQEIGQILFTILNGDHLLMDALKEADAYGEPLQLLIRRENAPDLPFELLYCSGFIVPSRIQMIRLVSEYGYKKEVKTKKFPLKVLFMACSPEAVSPVLDFEKEEEIILEITKDLPLEIDVDDTGSLKGLEKCLENNCYDVIHLSGHASIKDGVPYFLMEDETGYPQQVTPSGLWNVLKSSPPRLVFLSGCRTGEAPKHEAAVSFAHELVLSKNSCVLGWGLPVTDPGATLAAACLYFQLSRGKSILDAVFSVRQELYDKGFPDWSLLRLFSDGTPLNVPLVEEGQKVEVKARDIQHAYLRNSQVKVLEKGFVGRRRQIQRGIKCLKDDNEKAGLLLHGTGGLGKSCLAARLCERFKDHALIIVHGELSESEFQEAVKDALIRTGDEGLKILEEKMKIPDKIRVLCSRSFQKRRYLILLDDFEKNLEGYEQGNPVVSDSAQLILKTLLQYLPLAVKRTQLIITSRYTFSFPIDKTDLVEERLESIGLTSFRGADERKKVAELEHINEYPDAEVRQKLIEAGHGNPRLMEALNILVQVEKDVEGLLKKVGGMQEEFVQELVLRKILESQPDTFKKVVQYSAVYEQPVVNEGIKFVCEKIPSWNFHLDKGVQLSLVEKREGLRDSYWVTPLLRKELFEELEEDEKRMCHENAVNYYQEMLSEGYASVHAFELIDHALKCRKDDIAVEEGIRLLYYLRNNLMYEDAVFEGFHIYSEISKPREDEKFARFLIEFSGILRDVGQFKEAIKFCKQALKIGREVYGEKHPSFVAALNNLGAAWRDLGNPEKAIDYYTKALEIWKEIYGENHPHVAIGLTNVGLALADLGELRKAVEYYEKALVIDKEIYGENHPDVAAMYNNLGAAWRNLGNPEKAIDYYTKALKIDKEIYGENHPRVAEGLGNVGLALADLGRLEEAIAYYTKALKIDKEIYGEKHPRVAAMYNNLGAAWADLGNPEKAIEYFEKALSFDKVIYGEKSPSVARDLNNLGAVWRNLGNPEKAIDHYEKALEIWKEIYGENHPHVAIGLTNVGLALADLGELRKAVEYYEKALVIDKEIYGENHPDVAAMYNNLGAAWRDLRDFKKTIGYYEKALKIAREIYGEKHPSVAITLNNIGKAWYRFGDPERAIDPVQQAYNIFQEVYGGQHPYTRDTKNSLANLKKSKK